MKYRSNLASSDEVAPIEVIRHDQLRPYRHKIRTLAYVSLDSANGGILRDLSDAGMAVQALAPLRQNQAVKVRLELSSPRFRLEAEGRVAWVDSLGQAGVEFLDLPQ